MSDYHQQLTPKGLYAILDLPPELVLNIVSFLDHAQVVLFSLTCKAAFRLVRESDQGRISLSVIHQPMSQSPATILDDYPLVFTGRRPVSPHRSQFLQLLAYDYPHLFVCHRCQQLHRTPTGEIRDRRHDLAVVRDLRDPRPKGVMSFGSLWLQYHFTFDDAREAVAGKLNGPVPDLTISTDWKLSKLGPSCTNPDFTHGYIKLDTEAVVVDGCLLFHKVQRILILADKAKHFLLTNSRHFVDHVFDSCCHKESMLDNMFQPPLSQSPWMLFVKQSVHKDLTMLISMAQKRVCLPEPSGPDGWDLDSFKLNCSLLGGCPFCTTSGAITIHNHGRGGVELVYDTFQDLGCCSNPDDPKWEHCWSNSQEGSVQWCHMLNPAIFPTRPGKSARKHPSAPAAQDVFELHEHERNARQKWQGGKRSRGTGAY
ncbi:hypothetical protein M426DRAFT_318154 [Hypoxylon sp. CI-4A]|nr:hypothetical protein M426DRAFT_318154 [Hypoxylon sp. CI-4A]